MFICNIIYFAKYFAIYFTKHFTCEKFAKYIKPWKFNKIVLKKLYLSINSILAPYVFMSI